VEPNDDDDDVMLIYKTQCAQIHRNTLRLTGLGLPKEK